MKKYLSILAAISVVLSMTGCSKGEVNGPTPSKPESSGAVSNGVYTATDIGGTGKRPDTGDFAEFAVTEDTALTTDGAMIKGDAIAPTAPSGDIAAAPDGDIAPSGEEPAIIPEPVEPTDPEIPPQAGLLTGGEWNDNAHWADWNALYSSHEDWNSYKNAWKNETDCRIAVKVTSNGNPFEGAKVSCKSAISSAVTDNNGMAYLFYKAINGPTEDIVVEFGGTSKTIDGVIGNVEVSCDLGEVARDTEVPSLDFMIMCDTTGSMGDELEYLKVELENIVRKIKSDNANIPVHTSVNFYRDEGDEYVVRQFPFTDDIEQAAKAILEQRADGGGDTPEAVHTALDSAINNHDWSENSVKIMFLVLDAPPHGDAQIVDSVNKYVREAAEKGIRIVPIASSGIDKSTEYLLRTMAFTTGGTYTFLTDDSGVGGSHIKPTVGAYNVEKLSDMMIRIVNSYLA